MRNLEIASVMEALWVWTAPPGEYNEASFGACEVQGYNAELDLAKALSVVKYGNGNTQVRCGIPPHHCTIFDSTSTM